MLNVYLLRHGQTGWNADGNKYCGRTDIPLTPLGIEQAGRARALLEGIEFEKVYASPLERAHHTATIAGGGRPVETDERLIEVDFGGWEGKTRAEFILENEALWNNWCEDPAVARAGGTGETALDVIRRVDAFFNAALKRHCSGFVSGGFTASGQMMPQQQIRDSRHAGDPRRTNNPQPITGSAPAPEKNILVVGHNGINRLYLAWKLGMHLKDYRRLVQENSTVTLFSLDEHAELTLKMLNSR